MYAKVFTQIFDSSIAVNYEVRHFFEDMLKLADIEGVVDVTPEAISRRINLPLEKVKYGLEELMKPDPESRSHLHEGRRLIPLDSHRTWGWIIVNYQHYRAIKDEEARRAYFRDAKAKQRAKAPRRKRRSKTKGDLPGEALYVKAIERGDEKTADDIVAESIDRDRLKEDPVLYKCSNGFVPSN